MTDRLLSRRELAEFLGVPVATLARWAYRREGPDYYRVGRHTRYREAEVREWLEAQRVRPGNGSA